METREITCGACGGAGAIGVGIAYCDGFADVDRCDACQGAGVVTIEAETSAGAEDVR